MLKLRKKSAQSLLDYIFVFSAVVLVIAGIVYTTMQRGVENVFEKTGDELYDAAENLNLSGTGGHQGQIE